MSDVVIQHDHLLDPWHAIILVVKISFSFPDVMLSFHNNPEQLSVLTSVGVIVALFKKAWVIVSKVFHQEVHNVVISLAVLHSVNIIKSLLFLVSEYSLDIALYKLFINTYHLLKH